MTLTGHVLDGFSRSIEPRQMEINAFYKQVFGTPEEPTKQEKKSRTESAPGEWRALLAKAFASKSGPEIRRLWNGDFSAYPSQSEGDMALCSHFAFWLGRDAASMDAAFRESGLFRKKWDEKHGSNTYGESTIQKALGGCTAFFGDCYSPGRQSKETAPPEAWPQPLHLPDELHPLNRLT
jgi:putative DNA primase/helicase